MMLKVTLHYNINSKLHLMQLKAFITENTHSPSAMFVVGFYAIYVGYSHVTTHLPTQAITSALNGSTTIQGAAEDLNLVVAF